MIAVATAVTSLVGASAAAASRVQVGSPRTTQVTTSCAGATSWSRELNLDVNCDGRADMVCITDTGWLLYDLMQADGTLGSAPHVLGSGWGGFRSLVSPGAQRPGSFPPVWVTTADGTLLSYALTGDSDGRLATLRFDRVIGTGWGSISAVTPAGDIDGDGDGDVYGRASNGDLWLYFGSSGGIGGQLLVGTGWNGLDALMGGLDVTADGINDVIGRDRSTGDLRLYPGLPSGSLRGAGPTIGTGWQGLRLLTVLSGPVSGRSIVGTARDGYSYSYPISAGGVISPPSRLACCYDAKLLVW